MSEYKLAVEIIARSVANAWDDAKHEWELHEIFEVLEPETCLCGHFPIIELCVLRNKKHGGFATVGNVCVNNFLGLASDKIFTSIKRVRKNAEKSLNAETISFAFDKGWISQWDRGFYLDIRRKRNLTANQSRHKTRINLRVLSMVKRTRAS